MEYEARWNLPPVTLLASSRDRDWSGIGAELRRHLPGEIPDMVADSTVIGIALRGNARAAIHRRGNGQRQATQAATGTVWLCPQGVEEDSIRITHAVPQMLHLYLPANPFAALARDDARPDLDAHSVRYDAGFHDPVLASLADAIGSELLQPSSSGKLLVETAALTLAAWLLHSRPVTQTARRSPARSTRPLDPIRLARVIDYIETNLGNDIGVEDLAAVGCLSPFHFTRAFKAATGLPPHQFLAQQRLQRARRLLAEGRLPIVDVAHASNFQTQAAFTRAFRRATGSRPAGSVATRAERFAAAVSAKTTASPVNTQRPLSIIVQAIQPTGARFAELPFLAETEHAAAPQSLPGRT